MQCWTVADDADNGELLKMKNWTCNCQCLRCLIRGFDWVMDTLNDVPLWVRTVHCDVWSHVERKANIGCIVRQHHRCTAAADAAAADYWYVVKLSRPSDFHPDFLVALSISYLWNLEAQLTYIVIICRDHVRGFCTANAMCCCCSQTIADDLLTHVVCFFL